MDVQAGNVNPKTERYSKKRAAIIRASSVLINEVGVQATTLSEVARAIGLNTTSVTYYFPRKEQLVAAVYSETLDRMEQMAKSALEEPDPAARLRRYLANHVELRTRIRSGETGLITALSEIRTLDKETQAPLLDRYREVLETVRRFFGESDDEALQIHRLARAHILLEAMMWWPVWSLRYSVLDFPRLEERLFDILAYGLPSRKGEWNPKPLGGSWRTQGSGEPTQINEFLRAATVMINRRGYRGASVNRIAESLNVTKGSFYHHHETKDDLVMACYHASYDRLSAMQTAGLDTDGDYWTRMSSVVAEAVDLQFFDPMPLLRQTTLQTLGTEHKVTVVTRSDRLARRFAGILIDGIADGSVRPIDPLVASQVIMSTLNSAYEARHWAKRFGASEMAIATYVSTLSRGILADPD